VARFGEGGGRLPGRRGAFPFPSWRVFGGARGAAFFWGEVFGVGGVCGGGFGGGGGRFGGVWLGEGEDRFEGFEEVPNF